MARSQNGWSVVSSRSVRSYTVPGTGTRLPMRTGDVATVLLYVATRFHREVEALHTGWCWGFAVRPVRGQNTGFSNHASATAIDLNAPRHPRGRRASSTFSSRQIVAIQRIVRDCDGVVRWGGTFSTVPDGMHFEIIGSPAAVRRLAIKIRGFREATTPTTSISHVLRKDSPYHGQVMLLQKTLRHKDIAAVSVDGDFGDRTVAATKAAQKKYHLTADGIVGPATAKALGIKWTGN